MIHPQGADVSSEELTGTVVVGMVVVVVDWPVSAATAAPNSASTRLITPAFGSVVVVFGAVVVVVGGAVVVVGAWVVVVLCGLLVVVVEASARAEDSTVAVLVVVRLAMGSLVELAIGRDALGPPDPHPATITAVAAMNPAIPSRRSSLVLVRCILTSVPQNASASFEAPCHIGHREARVKGTRGEARAARTGGTSCGAVRVAPTSTSPAEEDDNEGCSSPDASTAA
jgi:hypothetical protein